MLLDAMHLTSPKFDLDQISRGLYTENEIKLINNMANCYIRAGRHYDAIDILKPLFRYLQTNLKTYHLIGHRFLWWLLIMPESLKL